MGKSGKCCRGSNRVQSKRPDTVGAVDEPIHQLAGSSAAVDIGTNLIYRRTQPYGAGQGGVGRDSRNHPIPWGRIPARPFWVSRLRAIRRLYGWRWLILVMAFRGLGICNLGKAILGRFKRFR